MKIQIGQNAPDFTLQKTDREEFTLSDYFGEHNIVLLFFPLAFSSTCTKEMCTMNDNMKMYNSLNARVLGVSVDSFFTLKEFKKAENLKFTLLSDFNKNVSEEYGVLYEDYFGMKGVSKRAAFVINREGEVVHTEINEDSGKQPDYDAIQKVLRQLS